MGAQGPAGAAAPTSDFAEFYALMPGDNTATVAVGASFPFPRNGETSAASSITRLGASTFQLAAAGVYSVAFYASIDEAAQLVLSVNGAELAATAVGRAVGTSQLAGVSLVRTTGPNSVLSVGNPASASTALTVTPNAGGALAVTARIVIQRLA